MAFEFFYRISEFGLVPGSKTAGFVLHVSTAALQQLRAMHVPREEYQQLLNEVEERVFRSRLVSEAELEMLAIETVSQSACPFVFSNDPATGGSIGARPEDVARLERGVGEEYFGPSIEYTPHNVDSPVQAMVLMIAVQTWAEWAYAKLQRVQAGEMTPLKLKEIPSYGDLMTLEEFRCEEDRGCLLSDDGDGYYATATGMSDIRTNCPEPDWATHVVWFNR